MKARSPSLTTKSARPNEATRPVRPCSHSQVGPGDRSLADGTSSLRSENGKMFSSAPLSHWMDKMCASLRKRSGMEKTTPDGRFRARVAVENRRRASAQRRNIFCRPTRADCPRFPNPTVLHPSRLLGVGHVCPQRRHGRPLRRCLGSHRCMRGENEDLARQRAPT
jgi:hypothetical protein